MDLGFSIFLIFVRYVALRNLELLIKTGWKVFLRFVVENAGRGYLKKNQNAPHRRQQSESIEAALDIE